jgi:glucokinase
VTRLLAADVGGTKTLLAIVELDGAGFEIVRQDRFDSGKHAGLTPILSSFVRPDDQLRGACLAIAGPVDDDVVETSNLPWTIRAAELAETLALPRVTLINDFAAIGWGIPHLGPGDVATLQAGKPVAHGPIAYLGAGTGLGQGFMTWNAGADGYDVHASEGGHGDFAARDEVEFAIQQSLAREFGHVSYERLISGMGIVSIYKALVEELGRAESPEVRAEMDREDPAAVISRRAVAKSDGTCGEALDRFIAIYGAEAGNLALRLLATGGLYVAGGIAPRIIDRLREGSFMGAFNDKGRLSPLCMQMPVHVILNTQVGLLGAAACATRALAASKG